MPNETFIVVVHTVGLSVHHSRRLLCYDLSFECTSALCRIRSLGCLSIRPTHRNNLLFRQMLIINYAYKWLKVVHYNL